MSFKYHKNYPIVLGLAGKAGSGKTSVAESLCPKGSFATENGGILWEHIFHALPLYELASVKKNIKGSNEKNRKLYAIHNILYEIYGKSTLGDIPSYEDFTKKVYDIYSLPIEPEGQKPRTFLQRAGDICREGYDGCFSLWVLIKSAELYRARISSLSEEQRDQDPAVCIIVSDVRFMNEAKNIIKQPNGMLITFDASEGVLRERIYKRDGVYMTDEQLNHKSESEIDEIKSISNFVLNTDMLSLEDQALATLNAVTDIIQSSRSINA